MIKNQKLKQKLNLKRTNQQNKALHKWLNLLADEFNEKGLTVNLIIEDLQKKGVETQWDTVLVKEIVWKPVQEKILKKGSTTELDKVKDIDRIYDALNLWLAKKGIHIPWPNIENNDNDKRD